MTEVTEADVTVGMSINQYALVQGMLSGFTTLLKGTVENTQPSEAKRAEVAGVIASITETKASLHQSMLDAVAAAAGRGVES